MDAKELILSDLDSIDKNKLELVDRWFINDNGKQIDVQIENHLDEQVIYAPPFEKMDQMILINFIERYCGATRLEAKNTKNYFYDPETKGKITMKAGAFIFNYNLQFGQQTCNTEARYSTPLGEDIDVIYCDLSGDKKDQFSIYSGDGFNILFSKEELNLTYLFGYFNVNSKQSLYSIFKIDHPDYVTIADYGIKYLGDFEKGHPLWMREDDNLTFDLTVYSDQKNKDFTKGLVALPLMMTSMGISIQSEMFIPMRKTEIKDNETRVVYNYLYRL